MRQEKPTASHGIRQFGEWLGAVRHILYVAGLVAAAVLWLVLLNVRVTQNEKLDAEQQKTLTAAVITQQKTSELLAEITTRLDHSEKDLERVFNKLCANNRIDPERSTLSDYVLDQIGPPPSYIDGLGDG